MTVIAAATAIAAAAVVGTYSYTQYTGVISTMTTVPIRPTTPLTRPLTRPLTSPVRPAFKALEVQNRAVTVAPGKVDETKRAFSVRYSVPATNVRLVLSEGGRVVNQSSSVSADGQTAFELAVNDLKYATSYDYLLTAETQTAPRMTSSITGKFTTGKAPVATGPRSTPAISVIALPTTSLADGIMVLSRVSIAAGAKGDISLQKVAFRVSSANTKLTLSAPVLREVGSGVNLPAAVTIEPNTSCGLSVTSKTDRCIIARFSSEMIVAAGKSKSFDLRVNVSKVAAGNKLVTTLLKDEYAWSGSLSDLTSAYQRVLWSDLSAVPHSMASRDWYNASKLTSFPTGSQTLTR